MKKAEYPPEYPIADAHQPSEPGQGARYLSHRQGTVQFPFLSFSFHRPGKSDPSWILFWKRPEVAVVALGTILWGGYLLSDPFSTPWQAQSIPLNSLNGAQRNNVALATQALDGVVIPPGDVLSFNRVVGPRTGLRGYRLAPSYLEGDTTGSMGGGICVVSSKLYQLALASGLTVLERVPHLKTVRTVPPGLDATVWYGQADLKLKNPYPYPLQLRMTQTDQALTLGLQGPWPPRNQRVQRRVLSQSPKALVVQTLVSDNGDTAWKTVSLDRYGLKY